MKINISALDNELRVKVGEVASQLGFEMDVNGYAIEAQKGEEFSVKFDGNKFFITYDALNRFFRGLMLVAKSGAKKGFAVNEKCVAEELGIMLDCSRNAVRNLTHLKQIIRNLALMGYNQIQLYTEDTYEVKGEPYFGYMRGRYTISEMKQIDEYAYSYGIEVVPCIQTLAHLNQIFRWRDFGACHDIDDILLIDEPRTYELIEKMFSTLSECFRSRKIHLGMDEAHHIGRGRYEDLHGGVANRSELILKHLNKVVEMAEKYGYKPMMWSDMFFRLAFGGNYYVKDGEDASIPDDVMAKVPQNLRLVYWDYYSREYSTYENMMKSHLKFNREVMFGGGAWTWTGFAPQNAFSFETTKLALQACKNNNINKIMFTMWGDNGAECSALGVLPTLCMASEYLYGNEENYEDAFKALTGISAKDYLTIDIANLVEFDRAPNVNNRCKYMLYNDVVGGILDHASKIGQGAVYAQNAKKLKAVEKNAGEFAYVFKTQRLLCEVLELKFDLGAKIRQAYAAGDKNALKTLVKKNVTPLIKRVNAFYETFREQWMKENKPFGFEVQDYRIGGLIKRIEHCKKMIMDFVNGKCENIALLDENCIDFEPSLREDGAFNSFALNVSTSIM